MTASAWPREKHATASVFILRRVDRRVQMAVHWHEGLRKWLVPGGHVEADETAASAACREVLEEIGVRIRLYDASPVAVSAGSIERPNPLPLAVVEEVVPGLAGKLSHVHVDHLFAAALDLPAAPVAAESTPRWVDHDELLGINAFRITQEIGAELLRPGSPLAVAVLGDSP
jgi:8-oxo-dGTP pyrophosphatase MutT (NUDIX family)